MGFALGWIAFALAGVGAAPHSERDVAPIAYTVRVVEAEGVGWREAVFTRLKPVTRQGAATVWTLPMTRRIVFWRRYSRTPLPGSFKPRASLSFPGVPATVSSRHNQQMVTQAAWNGDEMAPRRRLGGSSRRLAYDHGGAEARPGNPGETRPRGYGDPRHPPGEVNRKNESDARAHPRKCRPSPRFSRASAKPPASSRPAMRRTMRRAARSSAMRLRSLPIYFQKPPAGRDRDSRDRKPGSAGRMADSAWRIPARELGGEHRCRPERQGRRERAPGIFGAEEVLLTNAIDRRANR